MGDRGHFPTIEDVLTMLEAMTRDLNTIKKHNEYRDRELGEQRRKQLVKDRENKVITLEVGHGPHPDGFEPGAVDKRTGTEEWKMNHVCALACKKHLDDLGYINVFVTDENNYLSHIGRNHQKSRVFVSIHHNAFSTDAAQGSETLVHDKLATKAHRHLAELCSVHMSKALNIPNRGVKTMGLSVLSGAIEGNTHRSDQGVCLVEPYFITGGDVDDHSEWSRKSGIALGKAIDEFLKYWRPL